MADDTQLMKGILEGCFLALLRLEPSHGYRVVERLNAFGFDTVEATVYPILNRSAAATDCPALQRGVPDSRDGALQCFFSGHIDHCQAIEEYRSNG